MKPLGTLKLVERSTLGEWIPSLLLDCPFSSYSCLPLFFAPSQPLQQEAVLLQAVKLHKWDPSLGRRVLYVGPFGEGEEQYVI